MEESGKRGGKGGQEKDGEAKKVGGGAGVAGKIAGNPVERAKKFGKPVPVTI
jgi:hypothetical protein